MLEDLDFCEVPPAKISGYVFQDGATIITPDGLAPASLRPIRNGLRTADDTPIQGVILELRNDQGAKLSPKDALPGFYQGETIRVRTDANGYFEFDGLQAGSYSVYEIHPTGYIDGLDTPGPYGKFTANREDLSSLPQAEKDSLAQLELDPNTDPKDDAIFRIQIGRGEHAPENNFSEVKVSSLPPPLVERPKTPEPPPANPGTVQPPFDVAMPAVVFPAEYQPPLIGGGIVSPYTWHLSIVNAGTPRGIRNDKLVSTERIQRATSILDVGQWVVTGMGQAKWKIVSAGPKVTTLRTPSVFSLAGAKAMAGDFDGDGKDELALFLDGEWLLDINGNGRWDKDDLWARLGDVDDLPVVGDWDGDGKDDIGIFGPEWEGDRIAIEREPGLPDPDNQKATKPKNIPPTLDEAPPRERLMQRTPTNRGRADLVDHIFRFGEQEDQAISGDFNGDGIASVGVFRSGKWQLDVDGDGKFTDRDRAIEFGQAGDQALVGDFDGDGVDEIAVVRGNEVIIDSNHNGQMDPADVVMKLESTDGQVIAGDFDGDGVDEIVIHQNDAPQGNKLQAALPGRTPTRQ